MTNALLMKFENVTYNTRVIINTIKVVGTTLMYSLFRISNEATNEILKIKICHSVSTLGQCRSRTIKIS